MAEVVIDNDQTEFPEWVLEDLEKVKHEITALAQKEGDFVVVCEFDDDVVLVRREDRKQLLVGTDGALEKFFGTPLSERAPKHNVPLVIGFVYILAIWHNRPEHESILPMCIGLQDLTPKGES